MTLPATYLSDLLTLAQQFTTGKGWLPMKTAEQLAGKTGRLAHVVPSARPFANMLYAALTASKEAAQARIREAPPGKVATRRFAIAARWLVALIMGDSEQIAPLEHDIYASKPPTPSAKILAFEFDASPWGGGGILWRNGQPAEWWTLRWCVEDCRLAEPRLELGAPKWQTFWEYLALALSLCVWAEPGVPLAVIGDNTGSLQLLLDCGGSGGILAISRELAWRRARRNWQLGAGHLPTEANKLADALSRLWAQEPADIPTELANLIQVQPEPVATFWQAIRPPAC